MPSHPDPVPEAKIDAVLPPEGKERTSSEKESQRASDLSRLVAHWMDEFLHVPGTKIRVGLDPLLGLFPVVGGLISSCISLVLVMEGMRLGMPNAVLARMGVNIVFNEMLDSIPLVGDFLSVFFRSNTRNLTLINRWKSGDHAALKRGSRLTIVALLMLLLFVLGAWFYLCIKVLAWAWHGMFG